MQHNVVGSLAMLMEIRSLLGTGIKSDGLLISNGFRIRESKPSQMRIGFPILFMESWHAPSIQAHKTLETHAPKDWAAFNALKELTPSYHAWM